MLLHPALTRNAALTSLTTPHDLSNVEIRLAEPVDAPTGTVIFVEDPSLARVGVAKQPGTTVLAIGAQPGRIFTPSTWESALLEGSGS